MEADRKAEDLGELPSFGKPAAARSPARASCSGPRKKSGSGNCPLNPAVSWKRCSTVEKCRAVKPPALSPSAKGRRDASSPRFSTKKSSFRTARAHRFGWLFRQHLPLAGCPGC